MFFLEKKKSKTPQRLEDFSKIPQIKKLFFGHESMHPSVLFSYNIKYLCLEFATLAP